VGAGDRWIPEEEYKTIRNRVPIVCVDLLPVNNEQTLRVGLIRRDTCNNRQGWCLVGGAVLIDEALDNAVVRHLSATLGSGMSLVSGTLRMITVAEYFRQARPAALHDPRKHAIALTYLGEVTGNPAPTGEASDFQWFPPDQLPSGPEFGFGQDRVVNKLIRAVI
jgi:ADP-ribose pyrophosphatase YjhB (NUDIX family)